MEQDNRILPEAPKPVLEQVTAPTPEAGLSTAEAEARQQQYGNNEIAEKKSHPTLKFLRFFWGPHSRDDRSRGGYRRGYSALG